MSTFVVNKEKIVMPRKNSGMWYEVHPTPVKGEDGKNLVYVRPKSGQKQDNGDRSASRCRRGRKTSYLNHVSGSTPEPPSRFATLVPKAKPLP